MPGPRSIDEPGAAIATAVAIGAAGPLVALWDGGFDPAATAAVAIVAGALAVVLAVIDGSGVSVSRPAWLLLGAASAFFALAAISLTWTSFVDNGWLTAAKYGVYVSIAAVASLVVRGPRGRRALLAGLTAGAAVLALRTLVGTLGDTPDGWFWDSRLAGPVGYQNGLAAVLLVGAIAALILAADPVSSRLSLGIRGLAYAAAALAAGVAMAAQARAALIAVGVALIVALLLARSRPALLIGVLMTVAAAAVTFPSAVSLRDAVADGSGVSAAAERWALTVVVAALVASLVGLAVAGLEWQARRRGVLERARIVVPPRARPALAGLGVLAALGVITAGAVVFIDRARMTGVTGDDPPDAGSRLGSVSFNGRIELWEQALRAFDSAPALGRGLGGFATYWNENRDAEIVDTRFAHSFELSVASELGVIGLLLLLAAGVALVWGLVLGIRRLGAEPWMAGLVAILVLIGIASAVDWVLLLPAVAIPGAAAAGAIVAAPMDRKVRTRSARGITLVALLALVAIGSSGLAADRYYAQRELDRAGEVAAENPSEALGALDRAEAAYPFDPLVDQLRARLLLQLNDRRGARQALLDATSRAPDYYLPWIWLGDFDLVVRGRPQQAVGSYERALRLHRDDPQIRRQLNRTRDLRPASPST